MKKLLCLLLSSAICGSAIAQEKFNGNMETLTPDGKNANGWITYFTPEQLKTYPVKVDNLVKHEGKYSLSIEKAGSSGDFGVIDWVIGKPYPAKEIELRGFIKTENVAGGYAGLWMRIDGTRAFDNSQNKGITGTTDWKEYSIKLPYDAEAATAVHIGALLVGSGKIWLDDFKVYLDGKPIDDVKPSTRQLPKAELDTAFSKGSGIASIALDKQQIQNLTLLGQLWGFLKYHHQAVAKGDYNWDNELFRILPKVTVAKNNNELSAVLEKWVDGLGVLRQGKADALPDDLKLKPDYGSLFDAKLLSSSLIEKIKLVQRSNKAKKHYYIDMAPNIGNPEFKHEKAYSAMTYPDAGYRLLTVYRYWAMINYFFPYKHLIGEDWNAVLPDEIIKFVNCKNATDYALAAQAFIARIHDTHASIWSPNPALTEFKGRLSVPFQAKFIEDKLVVTGYYNDTLNVKNLLKPGDVIEKINGEPVEVLVKKFLPYTAASNYVTQLRDLPKNFLLRTKAAQMQLSILRDGNTEGVAINTMPFAKVKQGIDYDPEPGTPGFKLIEDGKIGYVFPARYKNKDLPEIEKLFANAKGIIVDMRCYPSEFMPFTFVPYIKSGKADFVYFTSGDVTIPGAFAKGKPIAQRGKDDFKGKVVVIVNERSQSQAEYTTMAFQSSPNVTVIGSTTAGADGNVSQITLPGGISTMISGLGVYYPDGTETQRVGVKIDEVVKPTIKGVKAGKDEVLERAKAILLK